MIITEDQIREDQSGIYYHEADAGCDAGYCPDQKRCLVGSNYDKPYRERDFHPADEPFTRDGYDPDDWKPSIGMDGADIAFSMECGISNLTSQLAEARLEYKKHLQKLGWPEVTHTVGQVGTVERKIQSHSETMTTFQRHKNCVIVLAKPLTVWANSYDTFEIEPEDFTPDAS
jgi:hypothetical protein